MSSPCLHTVVTMGCPQKTMATIIQLLRPRSPTPRRPPALWLSLLLNPSSQRPPPMSQPVQLPEFPSTTPASRDCCPMGSQFLVPQHLGCPSMGSCPRTAPPAQRVSAPHMAPPMVSVPPMRPLSIQHIRHLYQPLPLSPRTMGCQLLLLLLWILSQRTTAPQRLRSLMGLPCHNQAMMRDHLP